MFQEDKLKQSFQQTLHLPDGTDYSTLTFARTSGWDSIAHMKLIAAIEEAYDIMIDTSDVLALSTYPIAITIVKKYVNKTP